MQSGERGVGAFAPLRAPHFPEVYAAGWIWNTVRWALGFLGAYTANQLTGSPRLVQLTGTFMWGPLLFAGLIGGAVSDRFERRRTVLLQLAVMVPLTALMGFLALRDDLQVWMIYLFMLAVGVGWVVDMTVRRAMIYDLVGAEHVNGAMALEMLSSAAGLAIGALVGGTVIQALGVGQAYLVVAGALMAALVIMARVPSTPAAPSRERPPPFFATVAEGFLMLPTNLALVSILGVTVLVDFFHFSFVPIVQVIGGRVDASPSAIGLISAATGIGMMIGSYWVAARSPHRGRAYVYGSMAACVLLLGLATVRSYPVILISALTAGVAMGLFGSTQIALAITSTTAEMRGRAMGLLSMAIGALPLGMYALGELAEVVGAPTALVVFNLAGLLGLLAWVRVRPEVLATR
jgi:MFS family permease